MSAASQPSIAFRAAGATDTGLLRDQNEDRYWIDPQRGVCHESIVTLRNPRGRHGKSVASSNAYEEKSAGSRQLRATPAGFEPAFMP